MSSGFWVQVNEELNLENLPWGVMVGSPYIPAQSSGGWRWVLMRLPCATVSLCSAAAQGRYGDDADSSVCI